MAIAPWGETGLVRRAPASEMRARARDASESPTGYRAREVHAQPYLPGRDALQRHR